MRSPYPHNSCIIQKNRRDPDEGRFAVCPLIPILWNILLRGKEHTYNVGGVSHTTIAELAALIGEKLNASVVCPEEEQGLHGAPKDVFPDVNRAISEFGKTNFVSLNDGLDRTIEWYRENLS